jgi:hypothetical protein
LGDYEVHLGACIYPQKSKSSSALFMTKVLVEFILSAFLPELLTGREGRGK